MVCLEERRLRASAGAESLLLANPESLLLATASEDTTVKLLRVRTASGTGASGSTSASASTSAPQPEQLATLAAHISSVRCLCVAPDDAVADSTGDNRHLILLSGGGRSQLIAHRIDLHSPCTSRAVYHKCFFYKYEYTWTRY